MRTPVEMSTERYRVELRFDGTWIAVREGSTRPAVRASTLDEACRRIVVIAKWWNAQVVVHHNGTEYLYEP
ncbi:MAG: hypothetical protein IPG10_02095 [Flavobacteriales bacterium]|nr:hypothetical protein [Flavobacteriales bacterium]MBK6753015.1 hypothetical protein [Flavobacteriales bacterium]MBK7085723.1 hypothetical protein [Flavobacteriales bacterium]MBK7268387.1 hypothetical protein [Flavobacteriales bacterium]MBK7752781.1 hypothetical protein [Flavobacteriales bacterium]